MDHIVKVELIVAAICAFLFSLHITVRVIKEELSMMPTERRWKGIAEGVWGAIFGLVFLGFVLLAMVGCVQCFGVVLILIMLEIPAATADVLENVSKLILTHVYFILVAVYGPPVGVRFVMHFGGLTELFANMWFVEWFVGFVKWFVEWFYSIKNWFGGSSDGSAASVSGGSLSCQHDWVKESETLVGYGKLAAEHFVCRRCRDRKTVDHYKPGER